MKPEFNMQNETKETFKTRRVIAGLFTISSKNFNCSYLADNICTLHCEK